MLGDFGEVYVIDWGLAKLQAGAEPGARPEQAGAPPQPLASTPGTVTGTLAYMSPEQAHVRHTPLDKRSDVFTLGVILFELLTGHRARLDANDATVTQLAAAAVRPSDLADARAVPWGRRLRGDLDAIVLRATAERAGLRYASADALAEDIERYLDLRPVAARTSTAWYRYTKLVRRRWPMFAAGAVVVALSVLFGWRLVAERDRALAAEHEAREQAATAQQVSDFLVSVFQYANPEKNPEHRDITAREVLDTGRQRIAAFFFGAGTAPTSGVQLVAVTFDIAEDNIDPNSDPLRNAAVFETYNGGEAIFALPNGMLAYVVFDQDDKIIASVPDSVAHDFRARLVRSNASTVRVFSGVSCANCHDWQAGNWGWQPVVNDLHDTARGLAKILDDRGRRSSIEALQTLTAQYSASTLDLKAMLNQARVPYQYRASLATNHETTRETVAGLADSYWGYWYDQVTAQIAARDLGQSLSAENAQLFLLRAIDPEPAPNAESLLREDGVLMRVKDGKHVTPAQWRTIFPNVAERTLFKPLEAEGTVK